MSSSNAAVLSRADHCRDAATGAEKSIYWTPQTGAHELFGLIRPAWMSSKGHGSLGYPTTGEMPMPRGTAS